MRNLTSAADILKGNKLLRHAAYINGSWVVCQKSFPVYCPSTNELISEISDASPNEVELSIKAASNSLRKWNLLGVKERSSLISKFYENLMRNKEPMAQIMTAECGKTIRETRAEVDYGASFLQWFAEESKRVYGDVIPSASSSAKRMVLKGPVGVVGIITPWNFPLAMLTRKLGAALAAGCTTVIKPSEETPLTALALAAIGEESGIPAGLINVLPCSRETTPVVGSLLCESPIVRKISFTGSTATGKLLLEKSAKTVKRTSLELGGNAPFIVFSSADLKKVIGSALLAKFRGNGQTCIAANRFYIQKKIHAPFLEEITRAVRGVKVGDPFDETTDLSSLINLQAVKKVDCHVQDAIANGAVCIADGDQHPLGGNFYKPTIIDHCNESMLVMREETFGPVISITTFDNEEEAIGLANSTRSGLAGYVFSKDVSQIFRVSEKIEVGMLGVNDAAISSEMIPFGGMKESGFGREGSKYGIDEYLELKYVHLGGL